MIHISKANTRRKVSRGPFTSRFLPLGRLLPDWDDHGLAQIGRLEHATLEAGALVPMHMHQNEEILSYLRKGTMHHKDSDENDLGIHNKYFMVFRSEVLFYDVRLEKDSALPTPNLKGKTGLLYVFDGSLTIKSTGKTIEEGDSIVIKDEKLDLKSNEDSDLVFFVLDEQASFS
ncbi:MAG TPA: hypothetical protein VFM80_07325 [Gracilimonas sp.]|uniref:pirin family protein n=1 Tax=Gracilimonas sp. TaxID=1974203 RepID=UPI002D93D835|nr:hypothetical protein [Gracilimonas sp.]